MFSESGCRQGCGVQSRKVKPNYNKQLEASGANSRIILFAGVDAFKTASKLEIVQIITHF
jgi:hypothetical protein